MLAKSNVYFLEGYSFTSSNRLQQNSSATILDPFEPVLKWATDSIKDVRRGRYLLQDRALEIFATEGNNALLAMRDRARRDVLVDRIVGLAPLAAAAAAVPGMDVPPRAEVATGLNVFGTRTVTQRWESGELSNFQYLMYLNTMAGRSYNDLNQYPVFPWVLADYDSPELDLDNPRSFRDLSRPMGAQTPVRAEGFALRFDSWEVSCYVASVFIVQCFRDNCLSF